MSTSIFAATEILNPLQNSGMKQAANMPRGQKNPLWFGLHLRLLNLRMQADLSSAELGAHADVAQATVINIENQKAVPKVDSVERIACALGVSPTWLAFSSEGLEPFNERLRRPIGYVEKEPRAKLGGTPCPEAFKGIPERLKQAREAAGMSLRAVARECELSAQSLSTTALGTTVPTVENVEAIAKALGVSPGWLAFGIGRGPDGKKARARAVA